MNDSITGPALRSISWRGGSRASSYARSRYLLCAFFIYLFLSPLYYRNCRRPAPCLFFFFPYFHTYYYLQFISSSSVISTTPSFLFSFLSYMITFNFLPAVSIPSWGPTAASTSASSSICISRSSGVTPFRMSLHPR
jgi:hypothetical protein